MSIQPTVVWRVRKLGSNLNGGGYDPSISGAGTDYSQQDAAQLTLTDIACSNTTTVTSATGGFTSAMIGNAMWLAGGGATAGAYFITAVASSNSITIDRAPGTIASGGGKVGGGWADPWVNPLAVAVAGNQIGVRGSGSRFPTTDDYAKTGFQQGPYGNTTNGNVRYFGENGRPRMASDGLQFYTASFISFTSIYFSSNGTNYASPYGMLSIASAAPLGTCYLNDCTIDQNGYDIIGCSGSWQQLGCEVTSTVAPRGGSTLYGIDTGPFGAQIQWCNIHDTVGHGVRMLNRLGNHVSDSIIAKCRGDGLTLDSSVQNTDTGSCAIQNVTIDANTGNGILIDGPNALQEVAVFNCHITNHTGSGKYGLTCSFGTLTSNDALKGYVDRNNFFGNTTDRNTISAGPNDTAYDPQYAAQSTEGYNVSLNSRAKGQPILAFPQALAGMTASESYVDEGGVQRQEGAA
ncbi:MAG TPA: right-handed parallel beta-helix repeat-containing protein [Aliidongia sp.]|uniref:right-handed parallel beta-helix repeat-containing protein n=1 Tax=Aliidongia sp. TaxID=1914230 RepID=UPI002DDDAFDA|nr:right-handed parallel beta-helix repeat-containing protein [Aliidongia sp.]HEV2674171.1 right-handed parallel beta-helix repeat-containing protein [Aliidongia sp.]